MNGLSTVSQPQQQQLLQSQQPLQQQQQPAPPPTTTTTIKSHSNKPSNAKSTQPGMCTTTNSTSTVTNASRSSKLKNFIWSKLASVRKHSHSSINLSPSGTVVVVSPSSSDSTHANAIGTTKLPAHSGGGNRSVATTLAANNPTNEKRQRRNIFHLFESSLSSSSSSKTKPPNTGLNTKQKTSSKNKNTINNGKKHQQQQQIQQTISSPSDKLLNQQETNNSLSKTLDELTINPVIDNERACLIDNSMFKSKIQAASRRANPRTRPVTSSMSSSFKVNNSNATSAANANSSSFLDTTEFTTNSQKIDIIDEPLSNDEGTKSVREKEEAEKSKPTGGEVTTNLNNLNASESSKGNGGDKGRQMNSSRSVNSTCSLTTNLLEINEDVNLDLFDGSSNLSNTKSLHDSSSANNMLVDYQTNDTSLKENACNDNEFGTTASMDGDESKMMKEMCNVDRRFLSKTIIYDNNFTNQYNKAFNNTNSSIDSLLSVYSSSNPNIDADVAASNVFDFKSKSCERLETLDDSLNRKNTHNINSIVHTEQPNQEETNISNVKSIVLNRLSFIENLNQIHLKSIRSNSIEHNNFDYNNKKLNYSKSLKLVQSTIDEKPKVNVKTVKNTKTASNTNVHLSRVCNRSNASSSISSTTSSSSSSSTSSGNHNEDHLAISKSDKIILETIISNSTKKNMNLNDKTNLLSELKPVTANFRKAGANFNSKMSLKETHTATNEPSWKELAFRKHTAWSQKNLEHKNVQSNKTAENNAISENIEEANPNESKVKSIISKFA